MKNIINANRVPNSRKFGGVFDEFSSYMIRHIKNGILTIERRGRYLVANGQKIVPFQLPKGEMVDVYKKVKRRRLVNSRLRSYLLANQDIIPSEWKNKVICFCGTAAADNFIEHVPAMWFSVKDKCWCEDMLPQNPSTHRKVCYGLKFTLFKS